MLRLVKRLANAAELYCTCAHRSKERQPLRSAANVWCATAASVAAAAAASLFAEKSAQVRRRRLWRGAGMALQKGAPVADNTEQAPAGWLRIGRVRHAAEVDGQACVERHGLAPVKVLFVALQFFADGR